MIGRWIFIRDGRLPRRTVGMLAAVALALLVATFPLRLALDGVGSDALAARSVSGTVWDGDVVDASLAGLPLGTLDVRLAPRSLFAQPRFHIARAGDGLRPGLTAMIGGGNGRLAISQANGEVDLGGAFAPLPVRAVSLADFSLKLEDGRCVEAEGTLGFVVPSLGPLIARDTMLSGKARCEDGALIVPMAGPTGSERLLFRLEPEGRWNADLQLVGLPVEVVEPLLMMGFSGRPNGIGLSASGTF